MYNEFIEKSLHIFHIAHKCVTEDTMIKLLNSNDQAVYALVCKLNQPDTPHFSISELASTLNFSEASIRKYLGQIKTEWSETIRYSKLNNKIFVDTYSAQASQIILKSFLMRSTSIRIFLDLLTNPDISNYDRAELYHMSISTFDRHITQINHSFRTSNITLKRNGTKPISVVSEDEYHILKFSSCLILEVYGLEHNLFDNLISFEDAMTLICLFLDEQSIYYDHLSIVFNTTLFQLSICRQRGGIKNTTDDACSESIAFTNKHLSKIRSKTSLPLEFINFALSHVLHFVSPENLQDNHLSFSEDFCKVFDTLTNNTLTKANLKFIEETLSTIINTYIIYPYKTSLFIDRIQYFVEALIQQYPWIGDLFIKAFQYTTTTSPVNPDLYFNDLVYWTIQEIPELIFRKTETINVLMTSDFGEKHLKLIQSILLSEVFVYQCNVHFDLIKFSDIMISDNSLDSYRIIISNRPIPCLATSHNFFILDDFPSLFQLSTIKQYINSI